MRANNDYLRVRAADDPSSTTAVVLDAAVHSWLSTSPEPSPEAGAESAARALSVVAEQLCIFLNAFLLLHPGNRVLLLCALPGRADLIYPSLPSDTRAHHEDFLLFGSTSSNEDEPPPSDADPDAVIDVDADSAAASRENGGTNGNASNGADGPALSHDVSTEGTSIRAALEATLRASAQSHADCSPSEPSALSAALARALCLIARMRRVRDDPEAAARILTVSPCGTAPTQYVATMNVLFAAQNASIPLDSLIVGGAEAPYLQQAAYLTGGAYVCTAPADPPDILQTLMTVFLVDKQCRDFVAMPLGDDIDFRAFCMVTGAVVDDGYACSVCLSTFDLTAGKSAAMCPVCSARFAVQMRRPRVARTTT